jgi:hypothetical protein
MQSFYQTFRKQILSQTLIITSSGKILKKKNEISVTVKTFQTDKKKERSILSFSFHFSTFSFSFFTLLGILSN